MGLDALITNTMSTMVEILGTLLTIDSSGDTYWGVWSKVPAPAHDSFAQGNFAVLHHERSIFNCKLPPPADAGECTIGGMHYHITDSNPVLVNNVVVYYTWGLLNVDAMTEV